MTKVIPTLCDPRNPGPEYPGHTPQKLLQTSNNYQNWNSRDLWKQSIRIDWKESAAVAFFFGWLYFQHNTLRNHLLTYYDDTQNFKKEVNI